MSGLDAHRRLQETPPCEPGESPFLVKGTAYAGHMAWVAENFPGSTEAFMAELSPSMRDYFSQTFLVISQFDVLPLACAGVVCARVLNQGFREFVAMRSRLQATADMNGIYRVLLRLASTRLIGARLPSLVGKYVDFIDVSVSESSSNAVKFEFRGVPSLLSDWMLGICDGYVDIVITAAGAVAPTVDARAVPMGRSGSFELSRLQGTISWR